MRTSTAWSLPSVPLMPVEAYVVTRFDISDVLLDEVGDHNVDG
jgi:hypothetical protein